jgi:hypothetical protein
MKGGMRMIKRKNLKGEQGVKTNNKHLKKSYATPKLIIYGSVEKLTQGAAGTGAEPRTLKRF